MEELPLDPDTADRILSGQVAPDDAPPGYAALSALIRAAHQAPVGDELPGEEEAVEHMLASMAAPREWTAPPSRRSGRGMRMRAAVVATVTVVASTSGFAAAGALPRGAQSVVSKVLGSVGLDIPDPAETTEVAATAETDAGSDDNAPDASLANRAERETTTTAAGAAVTSSSSSSTSSSSTTTTAAPAVSPTGDECGAITDTTVDGTTGDSSTTSSSSSSTSTSSSSTTSTTTTSSTTTTTQPEGSSTTTTASDGSTTTTTIATDPECADDAATEVTKEGTDDTVSSPSKASGNGEAKAAGRRKANDSSSTEGSATETSETSP